MILPVVVLKYMTIIPNTTIHFDLSDTKQINAINENTNPPAMLGRME